MSEEELKEYYQVFTDAWKLFKKYSNISNDNDDYWKTLMDEVKQLTEVLEPPTTKVRGIPASLSLRFYISKRLTNSPQANTIVPTAFILYCQCISKNVHSCIYISFMMSSTHRAIPFSNAQILCFFVLESAD